MAKSSCYPSSTFSFVCLLRCLKLRPLVIISVFCSRSKLRPRMRTLGGGPMHHTHRHRPDHPFQAIRIRPRSSQTLEITLSGLSTLHHHLTRGGRKKKPSVNAWVHALSPFKGSISYACRQTMIQYNTKFNFQDVIYLIISERLQR